MGILLLAGRVDLEGPLSPAYAGRMPQTSILVGGQRLIMAIGGALRAAIRAGRFGVAGRESRRQARALASLNQGGPLGSRTGSRFPFPGPERGFDPARVAGQAFGESPRGAAVVVDSITGRRVVLPQSFDDFMEGVPIGRGEIKSPIEAPYEGVRVWRDPIFEGGFGPQTFFEPPTWMGRGAPPPNRSFDVYWDDISEYPRAGRVPDELAEFGYETERAFRPIMGNPSVMNWNIPRAFGGDRTWVASEAPRAPRRVGPSRLFFDDLSF